QDGQIARAVVHWEDEANDVSVESVERYLDLVLGFSGDGLEVETGGAIVSFTHQEAPGGAREMIGLGAAAIILLIAFGSIVAAGVPILMALFGLGSAFAGMALLATTGY